MKINTFLIKVSNDKEAVMRLPVGKYGAITHKARELIAKRFYDGVTKKSPHLEYALNLEAFTNGTDLAIAINKYNKHIL